ncbi:MAG: 50S ribosomal protein L25 [Myxococcales bacterium]|nr:50S ribosomal protein L25 [Myxococcales bacterium]
MSIISSTLEAKSRNGSGKGSAGRTRAEGLVPAIVYGPHLEKPISIAVDAKGLKTAIATPKKLNTVLGLKVDGKQHMVMVKDYQLDPVSRELLHADFIDVVENEPVKVKVPMVLTGKSIGVTEGGILTQQRRELEVWSLPGSIPLQIEYDVTNMKIGASVHINDLKLPQGITVKTNVNYTIAVVQAPEVEKVVEPVAAAAVPGAPGAAPGAPGTPAAGAAPAEGAKPGEAAKAGDKAAAPAKGAPAKK